MNEPGAGSQVVDLRSRSTYRPNYAALARNRLQMARRSLGLSSAEFGAMLSPLLGWPVGAEQVETWETDGVPPGDVLVAASTVSPATSDRMGLRSHKFIAAHIDCDTVGRVLADHPAETSGLTPWAERRIKVDHPSGECWLYVWPFGSAVFHLIEDLDLPDIASLALWRWRSYEDNLTWATKQLQALTGESSVNASYVLSLYWLHTSAWAGTMLDTALKILCTPRVLLDREMADAEASQCSAEQAERSLLAEGFDPPEMRGFGQKGVAVGYASWSGVTYHPTDPSRALKETELVACELATQAIWAYCEHLNNQIEDGQEPSCGDGYGWRFLRGARSRLVNPRPKEAGQHRSMRDAIVDTSGLLGHISQAIDALRDANER